MALVIRNARPSDAREMTIVRRDAIRSKAGSHYSQAVVDAWVADGEAEREQRYEGQIADPEVLSYVAEANDALIGFAFASPAAEELISIYVKPNSVGRVGHLLLSMIEAEAFKTAAALRFVAALNAVAFYESHGYTIQRPIDYDDGSHVPVPCMEMAKRADAWVWPRLFAPRISLEPLVAAHADELFIHISDPQALLYIDNPPPPTVAGLRERYRRLESRRSPDGTEEWLNWAIMLDEHAIGFVEATVRAGVRITLAYGLGRTYWSQGYGTEAVRTIVDFLASHFAGALFEATVDERNVASRRLLERIGLEITDTSDSRNIRLEGRFGRSCL